MMRPRGKPPTPRAISKLKQKINNLQIANATLQTESSRLHIIDEAVPNTVSAETLIKQIEILAAQNSVSILSFSISDVNLVGKKEVKKKSGDLVSLAEGSNELQFTFSSHGSYQNLLNLIKNVENLRRPVKIDSFLLNANVSEIGKVLTLTVSGRVPFIIYEEK